MARHSSSKPDGLMNADQLRDEKAAIRKQSLTRRNGLDAVLRLEFSLQAADHAKSINALTSFDPGTVVAGFLPIRSEIDARPLLAQLVTLGADICLPVVVSKTEIEFRQLVRGADLVESGFGTIGPNDEAKRLHPQILIIPLSAFDSQGGRLGYGAGYYDRAIEKLDGMGINPRLIGLAFSTQQVDKVPMEAHDRFLEGVITENGYMPAQKSAP